MDNKKLSVKISNKKRLSLTKSEAETIFRLALVYEVALYVKKYVHDAYKDLYTSRKRIVNNMQAKKIAEMAIMLLNSGTYTDLEYAVDDVYRALGCPCSDHNENMQEPTYMIAEGNTIKLLTYEDISFVENFILTIKFREVLKRTNPNITQGNKAYHICRQAISLMREGMFTDIEYALEEVVDRLETFDYSKHPLLRSFDDEMTASDDNYRKKVGLAM